MERIKRFLNKETILYLVFGVATTAVNYAMFTIFYNMLFGNRWSLAANFIAFIAAVIFAFVVNKRYVFESRSWSMEALKKEVPTFLAARVGSFAFEELGLMISEKGLHLNELILCEIMGQRIDGIVMAKLMLSVVVVILNYVFCKWFVFKK